MRVLYRKLWRMVKIVLKRKVSNFTDESISGCSYEQRTNATRLSNCSWPNSKMFFCCYVSSRSPSSNRCNLRIAPILNCINLVITKVMRNPRGRITVGVEITQPAATSQNTRVVHILALYSIKFEPIPSQLKAGRCFSVFRDSGEEECQPVKTNFEI